MLCGASSNCIRTAVQERNTDDDKVVRNLQTVCVMDDGCDLPPNLWTESPDLSHVTTNGCESYGHLNAD